MDTLQERIHEYLPLNELEQLLKYLFQNHIYFIFRPLLHAAAICQQRYLSLKDGVCISAGFRVI